MNEILLCLVLLIAPGFGAAFAPAIHRRMMGAIGLVLVPSGWVLAGMGPDSPVGILLLGIGLSLVVGAGSREAVLAFRRRRGEVANG